MSSKLQAAFMYLMAANPYSARDRENPLMYYVSLDYWLRRGHWRQVDSRGVPTKKVPGMGKLVLYNPTRVAGYALACLDRYVMTNVEAYRATFLDCAQWFVDYAERLSNGAIGWTYKYDWLGVRAPWLSCMAQGQGISVMVRAYMLTGSVVFLDVASHAIRTFFLPVDNQGVASRIDGEGVWFEECPSCSHPHVLNGFLYGLFGLFDYCAITQDTEVKQLVAEALNSLESSLERFDVGFWSRYDLSDPVNLASYNYHCVHIAQLEAVFRHYPSPKVKKIVGTWERYRTSPTARARALVHKSLYAVRWRG